MNLSKALLIFLPIFHPVFNAFENEVFFLLPIVFFLAVFRFTQLTFCLDVVKVISHKTYFLFYKTYFYNAMLILIFFNREVYTYKRTNINVLNINSTDSVFRIIVVVFGMRVHPNT